MVGNLEEKENDTTATQQTTGVMYGAEKEQRMHAIVQADASWVCQANERPSTSTTRTYTMSGLASTPIPKGVLSFHGDAGVVCPFHAVGPVGVCSVRLCFHSTTNSSATPL